MLFIGLELSSDGTRAVLLDLDAAKVCAEAWQPHEWVQGLPSGYREQQPAQWIDAVDRVVRQCLEAVENSRQRVAGFGVSGPQRGMVLLDASNRIIRPSKLAGDTSVRRQAEELARAFGGAPGLIELAGQAPGADSTAAECLWLKQHEPYHFQRAASVLSVQDFIAYWLTGERATEAGSASTSGLLDLRKRQWSGELVEFIHPDLAGLLPPVMPSDAPRGLLRRALADEWGLSELVQVSAGSATPMLSALAAGCVSPGTVAVELGTTSRVIGVDQVPVIDLRGEILPLCSVTGGWLGMASTTNASVAPEVIRRHYGWSVSEFESMVASIDPGADGLLMLPYLNGETIPRLPEASGLLYGITPDNFSPAHMARAVAEGVALGLGYAMSRLRELSFDPPEIRLLGSGAQSPVFRQLLADAFGVPVVPVSSRQGAAVGAAMQAAVAFFHESGETIGFPEIVNYLVSGDASARTTPNGEVHELYQELISRQQYLVDTLHPAGFL